MTAIQPTFEDRTGEPAGAAQGATRYLGLSSAAWTQITVLSALTLFVFRFNLVRLYEKTNPINGEANWGHSFCVPLIGLYYLYLNRDALFAAKVEPLLPGAYTRRQLFISGGVFLGALILWLGWRQFLLDTGAFFSFGNMVGPALVGIAAWALLCLIGGWGFGTMIFGLLASAYGIWPGRNDFVKDIGGVFAIFGLVLMMCGWDVMRVAWFPIAFLICAIPWPGLVYSWVASPLQQLAAQMAVGLMNLLGVDSSRSGTKIFISAGFGRAPHALNVAEACAGLRSLMTFIAVAVSVAFLSIRPLWQRLLISLSAIPIAILCNVMRVTGTGLLYRYRGSEWAEGFTHQFVGMIMLIPAFFMILAVGWALDHLFVEEADLAAPTGSKVLRRVALAGGPQMQTASDATAAASPTPPINRSPTAPRRPTRRPPTGGES